MVASADRTLLIVEDDETFARTLARSFSRRGYTVQHANGLDALQALLQTYTPRYAVVDLKLNGEASGLACVQRLQQHDPAMLIVVLTGYASIATAVEAIKLGATQYFAKPVEVDAIVAAFEGQEESEPAGEAELPSDPLSVGRLEWEHIQRVLHENDGNISATARALKMHRRTLQRKLSKRPVKS